MATVGSMEEQLLPCTLGPAAVLGKASWGVFPQFCLSHTLPFIPIRAGLSPGETEERGFLACFRQTKKHHCHFPHRGPASEWSLTSVPWSSEHLSTPLPFSCVHLGHQGK